MAKKKTTKRRRPGVMSILKKDKLKESISDALKRYKPRGIFRLKGIE